MMTKSGKSLFLAPRESEVESKMTCRKRLMRLHEPDCIPMRPVIYMSLGFGEVDEQQDGEGSAHVTFSLVLVQFVATRVPSSSTPRLI